MLRNAHLTQSHKLVQEYEFETYLSCCPLDVISFLRLKPDTFMPEDLETSLVKVHPSAKPNSACSRFLTSKKVPEALDLKF